ncbi:MAG: TIGR00270 family protein [Candidatus Woesearchaeota archaeon]|nr:MAG: TIGR00270 family protein [Candidatus Woesearchaeota archaeon]
MQCEMCGKESSLVQANVEGAVMSVCSECARFGAVLETPQRIIAAKEKVKRMQEKPEEEEEVILVKKNYASLIKHAREKREIKHEDLGKALAEKVSLLQAIEAGNKEPNFDLAKKLERFFDIHLLETVKLENKHHSNESVGGMTIADIMKKKLKK